MAVRIETLGLDIAGPSPVGSCGRTGCANRLVLELAYLELRDWLPVALELT